MHEIQKKFNKNLSYLLNGNCCNKLAVSVSGGSDSMLLAYLAKQFSKQYNIEILCIIVDHKLRSESTQEASQVSSYLSNMGIQSTILTRKPVAINGNIQHYARQDRYKLISGFCHENGIENVLLGHHFDDQIETFVMRNKKSQNIVGLSGMSAKSFNNYITWLRPMMNFYKEEILEATAFFNISYVNDPSNQNEQFERVVERNNLKTNISYKEEIKKHIYREYENRVYLEKRCFSYIKENVDINNLGCLSFHLDSLLNLREEDQLFIIRQLLSFVSGGYYPVKIHKAQLLLKSLNNNLKKQTLGGCFIRVKKGMVLISKENMLTPSPNILTYKVGHLWDNRFLIKTQDSISVTTLQNYYRAPDDFLDLLHQNNLTLNLAGSIPLMLEGEEIRYPNSINNYLEFKRLSGIWSNLFVYI